MSNPTSAPGLQALHDLTIPDEGSGTAREVLSIAMRRALAELRRLPSRWSPPPADRADHAAFTAMNDYLTAYLAAAGALGALVRRAREGGSYHVTTSLSKSK